MRNVKSSPLSTVFVLGFAVVLLAGKVTVPVAATAWKTVRIGTDAT